MKNKRKGLIPEAVKAARKGSREAEQELLGPGFHSKHKVHKSKKNYSRKVKHKAIDED